MKKLKIILILILSLTLTGCMKAYKYTDEQSDAVAEYMAGVLLENDKNYDQALIPMEDTSIKTSTDGSSTEGSSIEGSSTEGTSTDGSSSDGSASTSGTSDTNGDSAEASGETQKDYTLTQVIGQSGFAIQCKGYQLVDAYPEDSESANFSLSPEKGYQLLVASFIVKNTSDAKKEINLIKSGVTYQLDVNTGTVYKPLLTLLENDLQYLDLTIGAGKSQKVLLIFEVEKGANVANVNLIVKKDNKSTTITLK
ncbi:MAG TPA: hypothetical protein VN258_15440 [Mobilitalea sp.]|nr:hypothetical protein [Mobilitalea sp.]